MGEAKEAVDPFIAIDLFLIGMDLWDWGGEGFSCEGGMRVLAGVGLAAMPGPNLAALTARGARHPKIAAALDRGRKAHREFAQLRSAQGDLTEITIEGVIRRDGSIGRGRVDAVQIDHARKVITIRELKPTTTPVGIAADQLSRYVHAMTTDGRVVGRGDINFRSLHEQGYTFETLIPRYNPFE